MSIITQSQR